LSIVYSRFLLEPLPHLGLWRTPNQTILMELNDQEYLVIRHHFYSDLASVPNWAWPLLECTPNHLSIAGMTHDYLSRRDALIHHVTAPPLPVTFDRSLTIFNDVMEQHGSISGSDRWKIISAVKAHRHTYWQKRDVAWRPEELR